MQVDYAEFEEIPPNPEDLIKSIAEQGYSLEAALADLIDNCISAECQHIEIIIDTNEEPYTLYLADDGNGMSEDLLKLAMRFPSASPEADRDVDDLGRFGLGMKTASFSQTRKLSVLSRKRGSSKYRARTWDVNLLKDGKWRLAVNSNNEIESIVSNYRKLSHEYLNPFDNFEPNTIVVWSGLYKFENYLSSVHRKVALKKEISEITSDYLSLVFHRFMERSHGPLNIRINNARLIPFNPFPLKEKDVRPIEFRERSFGNDSIKIEGFVLPARAITESAQGEGCWTSKHRGLMDMEGIYLYRVDRIISFGGWNGMIKKAPRLQLARLRVDIGNKVDHLLHLNVAKSQIQIPHDLRPGFESYITQLKMEAEREYFNRGLRKPSTVSKKNAELFSLQASNKGLTFEFNDEFPLLKGLFSTLSMEQASTLRVVLRMVLTKINSIRRTHVPVSYLEHEDDKSTSRSFDLKNSVEVLLESGVDRSFIKQYILPEIGFDIDTIPKDIIELLEGSDEK